MCLAWHVLHIQECLGGVWEGAWDIPVVCTKDEWIEKQAQGLLGVL